MIKHTNKGLSLVEILGAVAVLATVATVSVISVKDTVQAGQKASAQKEIQNLNAALESFKSAGGVIPENATAAEAIDALQRGVDLAGNEYVPLVSVPENELQIAGDAYSLAYDPEGGFSYVKDGGGDLIGGSGSSLIGAGSSGAGAGYVPGVTPVTPENVNTALAAFASSTPGTPEYDAILADLAVALASGDLSAEDTSAVIDVTLSRGLAYDGALGWDTASPAFAGYPDASHLPSNTELMVAYHNAGTASAKWNYFSGLPVLERASLYRALGEEDKNAIIATYENEFYNTFNLDAVRTAAKLGLRDFLAVMPNGEAGLALNKVGRTNSWDLSGLDLTGLVTAGKDFIAVNFSGSKISGEQLTAMARLSNSNLSGLNLVNFNTTGKHLGGVNFVGSTITGEQLTAASSVTSANLSGLDLQNFNTSGKALTGVSLVGSNITAAQLNAATSIEHTNLANLRNLQSLDTAGKSLLGVNFAGSNISNEQLNASSSLRFAGLAGLNLQDFTPSGKDLHGVNFVGSSITGAQLNSAANLTRINLAGVQSLQGFDPAGKSLSEVNFVGSNITATQLNQASSILHAKLAGLNLQGLVTAGKDLRGVDFSGADIAVSQLNEASQFGGANLSQRDLQGLVTTGRDLRLVNFSGSSNITLDMLTSSWGISGANLANTGINRNTLQDELTRLGKTGWQWNLDGVTFDVD